jgi:hypothetical protein
LANARKCHAFLPARCELLEGTSLRRSGGGDVDEA